MFKEEFKQKYSTDFINSFQNFQSGEQFTKFNEYDEDFRERFFDYCFDFCGEENADIDKICEFAYETVCSELEENRLSVDGLPLFLGFCERVSESFPENIGKTLAALSKNYSNFYDKDHDVIDSLATKVVLLPKANQKQVLLDVLNNLKTDDIPWAFVTELAKKYWDPVECLKILKEKVNDPLLSHTSGIEILNILIARTADVEPEISKLMPEIIKHSDEIGKKSICELYINLFKASKNNLYLNSLMDFCNKEHYFHFVENGLLQKSIETQPNHEGVRIIMDSVGKLVTYCKSNGYLNANERDRVFLKNCKEIVDKKLLPAGEACDRIFNTFDYVSMNSFAELCESCHSIRVEDFTTAPRILKGLMKFANDYGRYKDIESVNNILGVFGDVETQTAVNIVLTIDENFDFLKFYTKNTNDLDIFYELNKKMLGKRQYLNFMIKSIMDNDDLTSKDVNNLLVTPLRDYARAAAENKEFWRLDNRSVDQYQKYDYLNDPNANLKERSIYGEVGEDISFGDTLNIPVAAINMVEALIPYVGGRHFFSSHSGGQKGNLNDVWSELVSCLPQEKQSEIYKQFEGRTDLSYSFVLDMALSSPEQWKKYGKYLADADGHKGLEDNPISRDNSPEDIFSKTTSTLEARPETRLKLEPLLRTLLGDNITDLYFENIDLMSQLRHRDSSYKRLINAPENKATNFLDAFTEKIKDIAAEPEFAGNRRYNCLSEAMDNNPDKFNQRAQETFEAMLQEKDKYFSAKTNFHDNAYVRSLFPKISNNVDELCEKIGVDDVKECLDYEKRFHKCAIGLYQYNEESREELSEEANQSFCSEISTQIVYDMADNGVDNVFWAMNTIKVFKLLNERPETYNSSKNEYPVELIVPYSKVNMPDWMYKVVIDNQLPQQRLGSVKNLFDKCNAVKRAPHLASWASEAKQIGKMPLWYQVAAGAITAKLHEGVSEREWKHNLELREIFWKEMKAVQEMGYVKAMQTYIEGGIEYDDDGEPKRDSKNNFIPKNKETRQAVSALLENKNIENDKDHYHATINTLAEKGAMNKMFAKENKSKILDSREIIKTNKIIAMRDEFKKIKDKKQKLNAIRDKHTQENAATTDHSSVRKPADNKVLAMRQALLKAKQSKQE